MPEATASLQFLFCSSFNIHLDSVFLLTFMSQLLFTAQTKSEPHTAQRQDNISPLVNLTKQRSIYEHQVNWDEQVHL